MLSWKRVSATDDPALSEGRAPEGLLSPEEQEVLAGFRFEARRRKWLLGRAAAKALLLEGKDEAELRASELTVRNEASGAPFVEERGARWAGCLSLSHREPHGVAAYESEPGATVGIDLELIVARDLALVRTFFTPAEQAEVLALESRPRDLAVARIWSAKEAVLKALRTGLRHDTRGIEISLTGDPAAQRMPPGFLALRVRVSPSLRAEFEGSLELAWREEADHVLTLATLGPPSIDALDGAT